MWGLTFWKYMNFLEYGRLMAFAVVWGVRLIWSAVERRSYWLNLMKLLKISLIPFRWLIFVILFIYSAFKQHILFNTSLKYFHDKIPSRNSFSSETVFKRYDPSSTMVALASAKNFREDPLILDLISNIKLHLFLLLL